MNHNNNLLIWASKNNDLETVELLLNAGADANYISGPEDVKYTDAVGKTALYWAQLHNNTKMIKLLTKQSTQ